MARKRIIYQSEALFAGGTGDGGTGLGSYTLQQFHRVQDVSHSVDITRTDINEFGKLAALSREVIEPPTVGLDFTYYVVDGFNECSGLGFNVQGLGDPSRDDDAPNLGTHPMQVAPISCVSGLIQQDSTVAEKNYYILTVQEGSDASSASPPVAGGSPGSLSPYGGANNGCIGIGNGFVTSYTMDVSVGDIPSASVSVEGSNLRFDTKASGLTNPAVKSTDGTPVNMDPAVGPVMIPQSTTGLLSAAALRPGDISIDFGAAHLQMGGATLPGMTVGGNSGTANVQSCSLDLPLGRTPLNRLGNVFPFSREIDFPLNASVSVTANLTSLSEGALRDLICNEATKRDITITMQGRCGTSDVTRSMVWTIKGCILDSQNMSSTIGDNKSVDLTFSTQIGGPEDQENGVFISGQLPGHEA